MGLFQTPQVGLLLPGRGPTLSGQNRKCLPPSQSGAAVVDLASLRSSEERSRRALQRSDEHKARFSLRGTSQFGLNRVSIIGWICSNTTGNEEM